MCNVICSRNVLSSKKKSQYNHPVYNSRLPGHSVVKRQWCGHYNLGAPGALWEHILYRWINAHIPCHSQQHKSFNWVYYHHWGLITHLTHCGLKNGLCVGAWQYQAITCTDVEYLLICLYQIHLEANSQQVLNPLFCLMVQELYLSNHCHIFQGPLSWTLIFYTQTVQRHPESPRFSDEE